MSPSLKSIGPPRLPPPPFFESPVLWSKTCTRNSKDTPANNHVFPCLWQADLNANIDDEGSAFYGVSSQYESPENMIITCSTKVCSFGKQVVEKVEVGATWWV